MCFYVNRSRFKQSFVIFSPASYDFATYSTYGRSAPNPIRLYYRIDYITFFPYCQHFFSHFIKRKKLFFLYFFCLFCSKFFFTHFHNIIYRRFFVIAEGNFVRLFFCFSLLWGIFPILGNFSASFYTISSLCCL